jgi:hypothetical protein
LCCTASAARCPDSMGACRQNPQCCS